VPLSDEDRSVHDLVRDANDAHRQLVGRVRRVRRTFGHDPFAVTVEVVQSSGTVRVWYRSEGWGVIDSPDTPGGCFAHFSSLWNDDVPTVDPGEVIEISGGFRELFEGETVDFEWERTAAPGSQDGYSFRASTVHPHGRRPPHRVIRHYKAGSAGSQLQMGPVKRLDGTKDQEPRR
jgi:CspA family cold shock protein